MNTERDLSTLREHLGATLMGVLGVVMAFMRIEVPEEGEATPHVTVLVVVAPYYQSYASAAALAVVSSFFEHPDVGLSVDIRPIRPSDVKRLYQLDERWHALEPGDPPGDGVTKRR